MRLFTFLLLTVPVFACTDFLLESENHDTVVGRSMEFGMDLDSEVIIQPAGGSMQSTVFNGKMGYKWQVQYAYIGLNAFGLDWVVDGMNEAGLSIGALWFPGAVYPSVNQSNVANVIALEDVGDWLLSTCATIEEVKAAISKVQIWAHELPAIHQTPPLHLSLHDRQGKSLAIEFLDGKPSLIDNPVGVLTNAPKLEWHLTNLNNYINLSALQKGSVSFDGMVLTSQGQGFGMLGLPGDWTPPSRFVRIANFKNFAYPVRTSEQNVNLAFHLLNTVDIPYGLVRSDQKEHFDYTQWVVVKDLVNQMLYIRTYGVMDIRTLDFKKELQKSRAPCRLPIKGTAN